jgi:hypothetical protein
MDQKGTPKGASINITRNHPGSVSPRRLPMSVSYASALSATVSNAFYPSAAVQKELELERGENSASTTGRAFSVRREHSTGF